MIERFFSDTIKKLGTTEKVIYTAPIDINYAFITGFFISNITSRNSTIEVYLYQKKNENKIFLTSAETPLPAGSTITIASLGQRLQLTPGDTIYAKAGHEETGDVLISISELIYTEDDIKSMQAAAKANENKSLPEEFRT